MVQGDRKCAIHFLMLCHPLFNVDEPVNYWKHINIYRFCSSQSQKMKVDVMGNERALLGFLLAKIHKIDPDIIVVSISFAIISWSF